MNPDQDLSTKTVKEILIHLSEPIVFKNVLSTTEGSNCWKLLNWNLEEIADEFGDLQLKFRVGYNSKTKYPQWDIYTESEQMTMKEFLYRVEQTDNLSKWFYFDYKYMKDWFDDKPEIKNSFNWKLFGLDCSGDHSTMWIGSKGAHTNCHQDTYGCNLVAQTYGRKLWILFSPDCTNSMEPTRIPHEESTIYSKYNFFALSKKEIDAIKHMPGCIKIVTLEPKDVLFIPKGWWHYVECLDTSMSINIWLPLVEDCEARLKESLVNLIINTIGEQGIVKPVDQPNYTIIECINDIKNCLKECKEVKKIDKSLQKRRKLYWSDTNLIQELRTRYPGVIRILTNLTSQNMDDFTNKNNVVTDADFNTDENDIDKVDDEEQTILFEAVIDGFCHPDVLSEVSKILMKKFIRC